MNYYAVIDTNVLVSALLKSASIPGIVARESLEGQIIPLLNDEIIAEYRTVLSRPSKRPSTANLCWAFLMPPSKPVGAADLCGPLRRGLWDVLSSGTARRDSGRRGLRPLRI